MLADRPTRLRVDERDRGERLHPAAGARMSLGGGLDWPGLMQAGIGRLGGSGTATGATVRATGRVLGSGIGTSSGPATTGPAGTSTPRRARGSPRGYLEQEEAAKGASSPQRDPAGQAKALDLCPPFC